MRGTCWIWMVVLLAGTGCVMELQGEDIGSQSEELNSFQSFQTFHVQAAFLEPMASSGACAGAADCLDCCEKKYPNSAFAQGHCVTACEDTMVAY